MKKWILLLCALAYGWMGEAQQAEEWTYPVVPGTEEWKAFKTHQEMVDACQIPEDVLRTISTERLVRLCLDYPLLFDIYSHNLLSDGVDALYANFNGFREMVKRPGAIDVLSVLYQEELAKQNDILNNNVVPLLTKGEYKFHVSAIEVLMGYPRMQSVLTKAKQKQVIATLMKGYQKKFEASDENKRMAFESNVYARANIIQRMDSSLLSTPEMKRLTRSLGHSAEPVGRLDAVSNQLIKQ